MYFMLRKSNWTDNREYIDQQMKKLFHMKFISREELLSVTGLLAGGVDGRLKTNSGGMKFTRATDSNKLFSQQKTSENIEYIRSGFFFIS